MLVIRLRRIGKKNKPTYRVVVAEHSYPINGKFTADLGFYNPHTKKIGLKLEDITVWLGKGAKPSNTVARLLKNEKVKHPSIVVTTRNRKPKTDKDAAKAPKAAAPATEAEVPAEIAVEEPTATEETAPNDTGSSPVADASETVEEPVSA